jgi:hypothetical protein
MGDYLLTPGKYTCTAYTTWLPTPSSSTCILSLAGFWFLGTQHAHGTSSPHRHKEALQPVLELVYCKIRKPGASEPSGGIGSPVTATQALPSYRSKVTFAQGSAIRQHSTFLQLVYCI